MIAIRRSTRLAALLGVSCALPAVLLAQLTTASISGIVTDSTGATVPGAAVSAVAMSTGAVTRAQANGAGFYVLSGIAPGQYRLRVEKDGFQAYVREGVVVIAVKSNSEVASLDGQSAGPLEH